MSDSAAPSDGPREDAPPPSRGTWNRWGLHLFLRPGEDPVRFARIKRWFYVGLAVVALAEIVVLLLPHEKESHFPIESWPAFGSIYGLVSCVVIIVGSKLLGKVWLTRREDYYDS